MDSTIIPTYVTVKMAVATGLTQGTKRAFQKLLTELHRSAKRRAKDAVLNQGRPMALTHVRVINGGTLNAVLENTSKEPVCPRDELKQEPFP